MTLLTPVSRLTREEAMAAVRTLAGPTAAERLARDRILAATFFLVRNDGGERRERMECPKCDGIHEFMTWCCRPRPFNGLNVALYYYARIRPDAESLSAVQKLENLARTHPRTFGGSLADATEEVVAFALGKVVPISAAEAATYTFRVQCVDPTFDPSQ